MSPELHTDPDGQGLLRPRLIIHSKSRPIHQRLLLHWRGPGRSVWPMVIFAADSGLGSGRPVFKSAG